MGLLQQSQWLKQCLQNNVKRFNSANESPGKRGNNELRRCNEKRRFIYQNRKRCCGFEYHRRRKIDEDGTISVYADEVKKPAYVRYLWTNYGDVTLYGKNGIPVAPFRTSMNDEK